jgi:Arc/MetJ family transcription regulator
MRTTLELEDELLLDLMRRHPGLSKRKAVEIAIKEYLASDAAHKTRSLAGKMRVEDVSRQMRNLDRTT